MGLQRAENTHNRAWGFLFLHTLASSCYLFIFFLENSHPNGCEAIAHWVNVVKGYNLPVIKSIRWISSQGVMYTIVALVNPTVVDIWKLLRVDHIHIHILTMWGSGWVNLTEVIILQNMQQIIMLYTLNLYSVICQLSETEKKLKPTLSQDWH